MKNIGTPSGQEKPRNLIQPFIGTMRDYPRATTFHELFAEQVARTPKATAALFEGTQISYIELEQRSNQLARELQDRGIEVGQPVALAIERSLEMLIGLLGILKAGGAYIPLDPAYPADRIAYMLEDSGSQIILSQERLLVGLPTGEAQVICLDRDWAEIASQPQEALPPAAGAEDLAYIIYTSGSTGRPKGVEIPHRALVNFLCSLREEPGLGPEDRLLAVTTLSFDIAGLELYLPLVVGATVVVASRELAGDGRLLAEAIEANDITVMQATPASWRLLLEAGWTGKPDMRIFCGGEALSRELAEQLLPCGAELWNLYGPTEATIWSTLQRVKSDIGSVPIGHPISNTEIQILDGALRPVPSGEVGELFIGGDGLARGYFKRPELTADRFLSHPSAPESGQRLYRTGDLARTLPDGTLEHLGRVDFQVKVRGFRIELGEIEASLEQQPGVSQAVVMAREDQPGDKQLVAYTVVRKGVQTTSRALREALAARLPDYMIPVLFVFLEAFPLTPNGKVDRNALPAPVVDREALTEVYMAPRNEAEARMTALWSEVLRVETIGVEDNFFELGGDSLKVAQVATRVREIFQVDMPLRCVFENPTVSGLMPAVEALPPCAAGLEELSLIEVERPAEVPLSFAQERVWFIYQLNPDNLAYNFQSTFRFEGSLDINALEKSLGEVLRRHESYRSTFPMVNGRPQQVVHPAMPFSLPIVDFSSLPEDQREQEAQAWYDKEFQRRFDLTRLPLVRWTLLRFSEEVQVLVHMEQHLVHDGWSFNVFICELVELYKAFAAGNVSPLPEIPVQFAEFATWQHQWMQGAVSDRQLAYWKEKFATIPPVLDLPTKGPRPATQSFRGTSLRPEIPLEICNDLRELSRKEGSTLFMTMLAAFVALLHHYTGETDVAVGTFFANRRSRESESLIGMILNNVVIRAALDSDPTVRELIKIVRDLVLESANYQDVPFDRVVEAVQPKRDLSYNPLFQVMFSFHDEPMPEEGLSGLDVKLTPVISNGSSKFDLGVIGIPHSAQHLGLPQGSDKDGLTMIWEHNTDLFETSTIARMIEHYIEVLKVFVAQSDLALSRLPILPEAERKQILGEWNNTEVNYPNKSCLPDLFGAQVKSSPDSLAIVCGNSQLTYRELDVRSNQLAHHLRTRGVVPDMLVGICLDRSVDMLVGLFGILKAGATYVPIDPAFPKDRRAFMIKDAGLSFMVSEGDLYRDLSLKGCEVLRLDVDQTAIAQESEELILDSGVTPETLAYVIYTSGSTGKPKGVEITHRALTNFLSAMSKCPGLNSNDRLFAVTTLSFDIAGLELYLPLVVGASVIIGTREVIADGQALASELEASRATIMQATPATWRMLLDSGWKGDESLKILCGGEALPRDLADRLLDCSGELWNMYGPTETTIWSMVQRIERGNETILVGHPIANTKVYILDPHMEPVPVGVSGELYIGGDGVGKGYWKRPELTAERFLTDRFSSKEDARLYRTGDLGRYLPDGRVEIQGRLDHQVKLRGFRIELGEIEAVLCGHTGIRETVVVLHGEDSHQNLIAYIVPKDGVAPELDELRTLLKKNLPDYMIPAVFMSIDKLPMTPNGKVDRNALPEVERSRRDLENRFVAAETPNEMALAEIWCEVLELDQVGVHDDFFDLGGHSLLAVRVFAKIEERMGRRLPLATLLHAATIRGVAEALEATSTNIDWSNLVPIQAEGSKPPLFCIHAEGGEVLFYRNFAQYLGPDQPVYGLQAQGLDGLLPPDSSIEEMAARYIKEIKALQQQGPFYLAGHCDGGVIAFEMAHQLRAAGDQVALLAMIDGAGPPAKRTFGDFVSRIFIALQRNPIGLANYIVRNEIPIRWERFLAKWVSQQADVAENADVQQPNVVESRIAVVTQAMKSAYQRYEPEVYPGRIACFVNKDRALLGFNRWTNLTSGGLEQYTFPGTFRTSFQEPYVEDLAKDFNAYLNKMSS